MLQRCMVDFTSKKQNYCILFQQTAVFSGQKIMLGGLEGLCKTLNKKLSS